VTRLPVGSELVHVTRLPVGSESVHVTRLPVGSELVHVARLPVGSELVHVTRLPVGSELVHVARLPVGSDLGQALALVNDRRRPNVGRHTCAVNRRAVQCGMAMPSSPTSLTTSAYAMRRAPCSDEVERCHVEGRLMHEIG